MDLDAGIVLFEQIGVDNYCFVAQIFRTIEESLRVFALDVGFKLLMVPGADAVPELGAAVVQVVDAAEVQVLGVPGEHSPIASDV